MRLSPNRGSSPTVKGGLSNVDGSLKGEPSVTVGLLPLSVLAAGCAINIHVAVAVAAISHPADLLTACTDRW